MCLAGRATIMNVFRIPLNLIVVVILTQVSLAVCINRSQQPTAVLLYCLLDICRLMAVRGFQLIYRECPNIIIDHLKC